MIFRLVCFHKNTILMKELLSFGIYTRIMVLKIAFESFTKIHAITFVIISVSVFIFSNKHLRDDERVQFCFTKMSEIFLLFIVKSLRSNGYQQRRVLQ